MFLGMSSCSQDECRETYSYSVLTPVYMSYEDLRLSVASENPHFIENPGKISYQNDMLFINEIDKGIHVFDNSNPSQPNYITFLNIPGNIDFSLQANTLYADSFIDLVSIDITDIYNVSVVSRQENVFPYRSYNHIADIQLEDDIDPEKGVITEFIVTEKEAIVSCNDPVLYSGGGMVDPWIEDPGSANNGNYYSSAGVASSLSRFALYGNHLYTIATNGNVKVWTTGLAAMEELNEVFVADGIETLFTFVQNKTPLLFGGSSDGLHILSIENEENPHLLNLISDITVCNPLALDNQYLYYSIRTDDQLECKNFTNEVKVLDWSNISEESEVCSIELNRPYGLTVHESFLYICDGGDGLRIYDSPIVQNQIELGTFNNIQFKDVISLKESIMLVNESGLFQYNYNKASNSISFLSVIGIH